MSEIHLFIIWEHALYKKEEIIEDIKSEFEIIQMYQMHWSKELFSQNLSRFYGTNLPEGCGKEEHCGTGPFLLILVKDNHPNYEPRQTSQGEQIVNTHMFDKKNQYREWTGGGHRIHATNSEKETNHDLTLLLGKNVEDYLKEKQEEEEIISLQQDVFGSQGWQDASEMFYALNNCCEYLLLRNYENLPEEIYVNEHNDIDVLCTNPINCAYILNATRVFEEEYRVHYQTKVKDRIAYFDLRHVGDNYYCKTWEEDLLKRKTYQAKNFYTVSKEDYFYSLLYHAVLHKNSFSEDYQKRLLEMNEQYQSVDLKESLAVLEDWMIQKKYFVTIPMDKSVLFNRNHANQLSELVYRKEELIEQLQSENNRLNTECNRLNKQIESLRQELNGVYSSRSWKSTSLLRKIKKVVKHGKES